MRRIFRPDVLAACILRPQIKRLLAKIYENGDYPNMIFHGGPGLGKSLVASILAERYHTTLLSENTQERQRSSIRSFLTHNSIFDKRKLLIIEDADRLGAAVLTDLKLLIERNPIASVIFTTNNIRPLSGGIRSRCMTFDFNPTPEEFEELIAQTTNVCCSVLDEHKNPFSRTTVEALVRTRFPDLRQIFLNLSILSSAPGGLAPALSEALRG